MSDKQPAGASASECKHEELESHISTSPVGGWRLYRCAGNAAGGCGVTFKAKVVA